jgi:hypothetical protein
LDGPEVGLKDLASATEATVLVHVDSIGAAAWDTADGKRPVSIHQTQAMISRPVELTVKETWAGTTPAGHLRARLRGGTVGCDKVLTDKPELKPGDYLVFLVSGRSRNAVALGSLSLVRWLPVTGDGLTTGVDGALSLSTAREIVAAAKK